MEGTDACFAPVLSLAEAPVHPHNALRETFTDRAGFAEPAPAPRFSATPATQPVEARRGGAARLLTELGVSPDEAERLAAAGVCS